MICEGCGAVFCPEPPDTTRPMRQRFCDAECKGRHAAALRGLPWCRWAGKIGFPTVRAAWAAVAEANADPRREKLTDVYPCPYIAGHWHTTAEPRLAIRVTVRGGGRSDATEAIRTLRGWVRRQ